MTKSAKKSPSRKRVKPKLSRTHKPAEMSLEEWQIELRRQFGREQKFKLNNLGQTPVFSDYSVANPQSGSTYRVAIRGGAAGDNYCTCADFATNTLGTCKHIEFTLARLRARGGAKALTKGFSPAHSEIYLRYGAVREVHFRQGSQCPPDLAALAADYFDAHGALRNEALGRFEQFLTQAARRDHDVRCFEDVRGFIAERRDQIRRQRILDEAFPAGIQSPAFDRLLKVPLYDYQREGALFAARAGRCLIGDEMGLGKTIQAIAAVEIMARHFGVERVLIVCPTSLKHQWEREIARFSGRTAQVIGGLMPRRHQAFAEPAFFKITNYDSIHRDLEPINAWAPDLVILDEAQRIKNWSTRAARSVKRLESPGAIVLTGTPLENRLEELISIVQFVDQHRLGPTFRFLADHQIHDDESGRVVGYKNLDSISVTLKDILIRRRKDQVLKQLPERLDKHMFVAMTPQQMQHHDENKEIVARIVAKWRRIKYLSEADQRRLMICLQNMRMSCDSTFLLDHETDHGVKADELTTLLDETFEQPGVKAVIFSQWLAMHELLIRRLHTRSWKHVMFHGGVPGAKRQALVDRFRDEENCRAFLATDAGGVGLNLQHASVVVNMDLPWNPAVLEQRIGRVHRLGQGRPVRVVNFVSQGTIEEGMLAILKFKKSLFAGALDGGEKEIFLGGSRLTRFIESVEKATGSIPQPAAQNPPEETADAQRQDAEEAEGGAADQRSRGAAVAAQLQEGVKQSSAAAPGDPFAGLLQTGLAFLEQIAAAAHQAPPRHAPQGQARQHPGSQQHASQEQASRRQATGGDGASAAGAMAYVQRDDRSGESFIKIPMPAPEIMDRVLGAIGTLLEKFRR